MTQRQMAQRRQKPATAKAEAAPIKKPFRCPCGSYEFRPGAGTKRCLKCGMEYETIPTAAPRSEAVLTWPGANRLVMQAARSIREHPTMRPYGDAGIEAAVWGLILAADILRNDLSIQCLRAATEILATASEDVVRAVCQASGVPMPEMAEGASESTAR